MAKLYEQIHDQTLRLTPKSNSSRADRKESDFATLKMNVEEIATELRDLVNLESRVSLNFCPSFLCLITPG